MLNRTEVEEVIGQIAKVEQTERQIILELPDQLRRLVLHRGRLLELLSLVQKSIKEQQWHGQQSMRVLVDRLLSEVNPQQGLITPLAYAGTQFKRLEHLQDESLHQEEQLTFAHYDRLHRVLQSSHEGRGAAQLQAKLIPLQERFAAAIREEKIIASLFSHLETILTHFRDLINLYQGYLAQEQKLLQYLKTLLQAATPHDELPDIYDQLQKELKFGLNLQIRLHEEFYKPFCKFTDEKIVAEDKVANLLAAKQHWYHLWHFQPKITRQDFIVDYYTMTSPDEVLQYLEVLDSLGSRYVAANLLQFIRQNRRRLLSRIQSQKYSLTQKLLSLGKDTLTGVATKRTLLDKLTELTTFANRRKDVRSFSLIMVDIDYFKSINDTYGHLVGDRVLRNVALAMQRAIRKSDLLARYGGEEFTILLPETSLAQALAIAEKIRIAVPAANQEPLNPTTQQPITISLGVATFPQDSKNAEELLQKADVALYRAKREGRNKVIAA